MLQFVRIIFITVLEHRRRTLLKLLNGFDPIERTKKVKAKKPIKPYMTIRNTCQIIFVNFMNNLVGFWK